MLDHLSAEAILDDLLERACRLTIEVTAEELSEITAVAEAKAAAQFCGPVLVEAA